MRDFEEDSGGEARLRGLRSLGRAETATNKELQVIEENRPEENKETK